MAKKYPKKKFFKSRTESQIRRLDISEAHMQFGLVERILDLKDDQSLVIRPQLIPGKFYRGDKTSYEAARKFAKHGHFIDLPQEKTIRASLEEIRLPHEIRKEAFANHLEGRREIYTESLGYSFRPIQGPDKLERVIPFVSILDGARLFAYALQKTRKGIEVKPFDDVQRIEVEGARVTTTGPSATQRQPRYNIRFDSVPVEDNPRKHAISLSLNSQSNGVMSPQKFWSFGFKYRESQEHSRVQLLDAHDVAAMLGVTRHYMLDLENPTPWNMNVFAKPSQLAVDFYKKLENNVIIADRNARGKQITRKLYSPEKSLLLARLVGLVGHDESMFWKPGRDPKLHEYDWDVPGN